MENLRKDSTVDNTATLTSPQGATHNAVPSIPSIAFNLSWPVLPLPQLKLMTHLSHQPFSFYAKTQTHSHLGSATSQPHFLPLSVFSLSSAGHKAGPFPRFCSWNEPPSPTDPALALACAFIAPSEGFQPPPPLDFSQVLIWALGHFSCLYWPWHLGHFPWPQLGRA